MKEEDKDSNVVSVLNFACGTESVQPGALTKCVHAFLAASQIRPSFILGKYISCLQEHHRKAASLWFAHAASARQPQGKFAAAQVCTAALVRISVQLTNLSGSAPTILQANGWTMTVLKTRHVLVCFWSEQAPVLLP